MIRGGQKPGSFPEKKMSSQREISLKTGRSPDLNEEEGGADDQIDDDQLQALQPVGFAVG